MSDQTAKVVIELVLTVLIDLVSLLKRTTRSLYVHPEYNILMFTYTVICKSIKPLAIF